MYNEVWKNLNEKNFDLKGCSYSRGPCNISSVESERCADTQYLKGFRVSFNHSFGTCTRQVCESDEVAARPFANISALSRHPGLVQSW
jgi:hypothetical protein